MEIYVGSDKSAPATYGLAVTPHDTNALTNGACKALFVGTGGNITMRGSGGSVDQVWKNVANGQILPICALYIRATGTTATDILALY
jgi:hypothetical protein